MISVFFGKLSGEGRIGIHSFQEPICKKEPALLPALLCFRSIPDPHFLHGNRECPGFDPGGFSKPRRIKPLIRILPGLPMINPFGDTVETGPQAAGHANQPVPFAMVEEVPAPATIPSNQSLFIWFCAVRINRSQIFVQALAIQFDPAHGLERLLHVGKPVIEEAQHLVGLFQLPMNIGVVRNPPR